MSGAATGKGRVCVIGGGMAGAMAALAARDAGCDVVQVARAPGATALCGGTADFGWPEDPFDVELPTYVSVMRFAVRPHHPFGKVGLDRVEEAVTFFEGLALGFTGPGLMDQPLLVATELGTIKTAPLVQAGIMPLRREGTVGVASLDGYPRFPAAFVARSVAGFCQKAGIAPVLEVVPVALPERLGADPAPAEVARLLDSGPALERLGASIRAAAATMRLDQVLFPPVLGFGSPRSAHLSEIAGLPCGELVAASPSVPGVRLQRWLEGQLDRARVRRQSAGVTGYEADVRRVRALYLDDGARLEAEAFVLATGKFLGGGIRRTDRLVETVFDLPVHIGGTRVSEAEVEHLTSPKPWETQRIFSSGVATDDSLRPIGHEGTIAYENLFAAGAVLCGYHPAAEGSGMGVAIATGYHCGRAASEAVG